MRWPDALTKWLPPTGDGDADSQVLLGTTHNIGATAPLQEAAL
jgi:hypothetical protein